MLIYIDEHIKTTDPSLISVLKIYLFANIMHSCQFLNVIELCI